MSLLEPLTDDGIVHRLEPAPDPVLAIWARFKDRFAEAMDGDLYTLEELERRVATHRAYLFAGRDCAIITEVQDYPTGARVMQATWACGDLSEIPTLIPGIEALARMVGCTKAVVEGRKGWERTLKSQGYRFFSVTVQKDL